MKRPLAYITAPWGADEMENTEDAARYCRKIYDAGFSPICPILFLPLFSTTPSRRNTRTASTLPATFCAAPMCWWSAAGTWTKP